MSEQDTNSNRPAAEQHLNMLFDCIVESCVEYNKSGMFPFHSLLPANTVRNLREDAKLMMGAPYAEVRRPICGKFPWESIIGNLINLAANKGFSTLHINHHVWKTVLMFSKNAADLSFNSLSKGLTDMGYTVTVRFVGDTDDPENITISWK